MRLSFGMSISNIIAVDCSGSTGNNAMYWQEVEDTILSNPKSLIWFWDDTITFLTTQQALQWCKNRTGRGGTYPACMVKSLPRDTSKVNLILVTDGQVAEDQVRNCDEILKSAPFASVDVKFINTGGVMNLSVSAPFTRNSPKVVIKVGKDVLAATSTSGEIDLSKYYDYPPKFIVDFEDLNKQITLQNLGQTNIKLRNELLDLQKNLLGFIAKSGSEKEGQAYQKLREYLVNGSKEASYHAITTIIGGADVTLGKQIEGFIQTLIGKCNGSKDFSFAALQPSRIQRAAEVKTIAVEELPEENNCNYYMCPILLDDQSIPVLCISRGEPVFKDLEKWYLESIMSNPLMVLDDPELVAKIVQRFDHTLSLSAYKELFDGMYVITSPMTRKPVSSIISVGNEKSHYAATNQALADIFFGKVLVGNPELWLAVVYFALLKTPYLCESKEFMDSFVSAMLTRMRNKNTNITLTGLPVSPLIKAPLDIAIWYCVSSPRLVSLVGLGVAENRLRAFGASSKYLVKLLDLFGYVYDKTWTLVELERYRAFAWMMKEEKKKFAGCNAPWPPGSQWRNQFRAQYQGSLVLGDGKIIMIDGMATDPKPTFPKFDLSLAQLVALSKMVDANKTVNAVDLPRYETPEPLAVTNYGYADDLSDEVACTSTPISPETFRPFTVDRKEKKHWLVCSEKKWGNLDKQISNYNYFIRFVHEVGCYPTKDEFIEYTSEKQANKEHNPVDTLPKQTRLFVKTVFEDYEKVLGKDFANVSPLEFKQKTYQSMRECDRIQLDGSNKI